MSDDWKAWPSGAVHESIQQMLEEQQRNADRMRDILEASHPSRFEDFATNYLRQTDQLSERASKFGYPHSIDPNDIASQWMKSSGVPLSIQNAMEAAGVMPRTALGPGSSSRSYSRDQGVAALSDSTELRKQLRALESELSRLRQDVDSKEQALREQEAGAARKDEDIHELQQKLIELSGKERLAHLLARVEPAAQRQLLESPAFREQFDRDEPCEAFVVSMDIRRSTELMLKAREPKLFAQFIMGLTRRLRVIVLAHHGIFDKFTGDGILAFFPTFYAGVDAGMLALKAASQAHAAFVEHYDAHRHCFHTVLRDVGVGIGLDYGQVQIVQLEGEFTVVGTPVVYACRMGGAEPGQTLVNQPAFEQLNNRYSAVCDFFPVDLHIKNEGRTLAYAARLNGRHTNVAEPDWIVAPSKPSLQEDAEPPA